MTTESPQIVIITGISGAGKSSVLRCFEDLGFFTVDNLPPPLMDKFIEVCFRAGSDINNVAMVMDVRGRMFFDDIISVINELKHSGYDVKILFLDAQDALLIRRYKETRRPHPLSIDGDIQSGLVKERKTLDKLKEIADDIIDTSNYNLNQLKIRVMEFLSPELKLFPLRVRIVSFGYKYGVPLDVDIVLDVRFLPNPFYDEKLRDMTGNDELVQNFVMNHPSGKEFMKILGEFISFLIPHYIDEGRFNLTIAVGCTGGKHRSVVVALKLSETLKRLGITALVTHRDIAKDDANTDKTPTP